LPGGLRRFLVPAAALGLCALVACRTRGTPEDAVRRLLKAAAEKDMEALLECLTPESRDFLEAMMTAAGDDPASTSLFDEPAGRRVRLLTVKVRGRRATVRLAVDSPEGESNETLSLRRLGDEWRVDLLHGWSRRDLERLLERIRTAKEARDGG